MEQSRERRSRSPPTPWCSSYRKGSLRVTHDYGRQLYLLTCKSALDFQIAYSKPQYSTSVTGNGWHRCTRKYRLKLENSFLTWLTIKRSIIWSICSWCRQMLNTEVIYQFMHIDTLKLTHTDIYIYIYIIYWDKSSLFFCFFALIHVKEKYIYAAFHWSMRRRSVQILISAFYLPDPLFSWTMYYRWKQYTIMCTLTLICLHLNEKTVRIVWIFKKNTLY